LVKQKNEDGSSVDAVKAIEGAILLPDELGVNETFDWCTSQEATKELLDTLETADSRIKLKRNITVTS